MRTDAKRKYENRWQKENVIRVTVKLYKNTDADLIDYLSDLKNRNGYIKQLIRDDMKKKGK